MQPKIQNKPMMSKPMETPQKQSKHNPNSIFVKNIPALKNNVGTLAVYFSRFGEVTNVSVNNTKNTAVVRFDESINAKNAYMSKEPVLGEAQIQLVYNPGNLFSGGVPKENSIETYVNPKAPIGSNLTFESEDAKKQREQNEKKRMLKKERKDLIEKENDDVMKLIRELNAEMPEEQQKDIKLRISQLKASINQKLQEQKDEKKNEFEQKQAKRPVINNKWYDITLKLIDESLKKKWGPVFNKLKSVSSQISDCKLQPDDLVKVKLVHSDQERLKQDILKLESFEIIEIVESKTEKAKPQYGGYKRAHVTNTNV